MSTSPPPPTYYKRIPEEPRNVLFEKATYQDTSLLSTEIVISKVFEKAIQKATKSAKVASSQLHLDPEKPFQMKFSVAGEKKERSCCRSKTVTAYKVIVIQEEEIKEFPISKQLTAVARTFFDAFSFTKYVILTLSFRHIDPKLLNP